MENGAKSVRLVPRGCWLERYPRVSGVRIARSRMMILAMVYEWEEVLFLTGYSTESWKCGEEDRKERDRRGFLCLWPALMALRVSSSFSSHFFTR